ncbi:MAG: malto-oligosyltrehalose synthase [Myxococcaceae bacterium]|nr:malto-oligosyltrehalose synthase [Myxococcaceae bacterium]
MVDEGVAPLAQRLFDEVCAALLAQEPAPLSTYRLQLHRGFTLKDATRIVPYLARLGISHVYSSPLLEAAPGSPHGYDVVNHGALNPELGTPEDFDAFVAALKAHGMGLVLDTVPNHMGIEKGQNALWNDVLENGPSSIHARTFDVDWHPVKEELRNKVLLPILGDQYGVVLENGELRLSYDDGAFFLHYYDHRLPVPPRAYATLLSLGLDELESRIHPGRPQDVEALTELKSIITAIEHLPQPSSVDRARMEERNREKEVIKRRLAALADAHPLIHAFIEANVDRVNGEPGRPESFDLLHAILESASYRLAYWRTAGEEINYRRFFDINGLAAVRMEDREVFEEAHRLIFRWIAEDKVQGLRIDHPDGLFDPTAYFLQVQEEYFLLHVERRRPPEMLDGPDAEARWREVTDRIRQLYREAFQRDPESRLFRSLYVVVEKIQGGRERIPDAWAVHGTTGYRFANAVTGLFVPRENEKAFTKIYERFIGRSIDFSELVYEKKKLIMSASMSSEINGLARELNRISEMDRRTRDFTLNALRRALVELIALFPVYRTYIDGWRELDARDVDYIRWTLARAQQKDATTNASLYEFLGNILLRRYPPHLGEREKAVMLRFAMKLQQLTGPVMARGLEDTAFYVYNRLVALNEVGGEPERFGCSVHLFHLRNQERAEKWPAALLASSTHDTKRSEDVRARLTVLAELPDAWKEQLRRWARLNRKFKTARGDRLIPDANDEYLFYQTVIGAWPMGATPRGEAFIEFRRRIAAYMLKAIREAKSNTSWVNPDPVYEEAMARFVDGVLDPKNGLFFASAEAFKRRLELPGQLNALSAAVMKLASPGTPDTYQGCELWDLSLVDPDNRRPVDFGARARALSELERRAKRDRAALCRDLRARIGDGHIKLYVIAEALRLRKAREAVFRHGGYVPLDVEGPAWQHVVAWARHHEGRFVIAVVPRLVVPLVEAPEGMAGVLRGTTVQIPRELENIQLREVFSGRTFAPRTGEVGPSLDAGEVLDLFPVALLENANV